MLSQKAKMRMARRQLPSSPTTESLTLFEMAAYNDLSV